MDPNANLQEQREIVARLLAGSFTSAAALQSDAYRLAELCEALDEWLTRGGFLPNAWRREDPSGALPKAAKR